MPWMLLSVAAGAVAGAMLRWGITLYFAPKWQLLPAGTLICNLTGAFIIGLAAAFFSLHVSSPLPKLFLITGFLGSLTTFSTFSLESANMITQGEYLRAVFHSLIHLLGSVTLALAGMCVGHKFFS